MNDLVHDAAELARPLVARLQARIAKLDVVLADETSMRLQDRAKRGFVWVFHGHDDVSGGQLVLYVFAVDRSGGTPAKILGGTEGTLVVDGYTGYNVVTEPDGRKRAGCWSHVQRRFFEARATAPAEAEHGLELIRALFRVERDATEQGIVRTPEHLALRTAKSKPIVDEFFAWVDATRASTLPKSPLGEALGYAMNQRERLELFPTDASHSAAQQRQRGAASRRGLGRKTYLFVGHPRAGRNTARWLLRPTSAENCVSTSTGSGARRARGLRLSDNGAGIGPLNGVLGALADAEKQAAANALARGGEIDSVNEKDFRWFCDLLLAGLYSLVGSAIANGIEPTEYLTDVLPRIRDATTDEQLDALLPDRWLPLSSIDGERAPPAAVTVRY